MAKSMDTDVQEIIHLVHTCENNSTLVHTQFIYVQQERYRLQDDPVLLSKTRRARNKLSLKYTVSGKNLFLFVYSCISI